jgi:hypothetical protein
VTVSKTEVTVGEVPLMKDPGPGGKAPPPLGMKEMMKGTGTAEKGTRGPAKRPAPPKSLLPTKYASVGTTPFTITIPSDGKIELKLTKN